MIHAAPIIYRCCRTMILPGAKVIPGIAHARKLRKWAPSHAIFPGIVFDKDDPIVCGDIAHMRACTQEDVPAKTGWLRHESVWNYKASLAAHVYLWAGLYDRADRTSRGFLNHASPLYCWCEEQPLQHALVGQDWGDMPHNWASAECIRYLRHMFVLEDGGRMRLLEGLIAANPNERFPFRLGRTPTRFGRVDVDLEPIAKGRWKLDFEIAAGPRRPTSVEVPFSGYGRRFDHVADANFRSENHRILIAPNVNEWPRFGGSRCASGDSSPAPTSVRAFIFSPFPGKQHTSGLKSLCERFFTVNYVLYVNCIKRRLF